MKHVRSRFSIAILAIIATVLLLGCQHAPPPEERVFFYDKAEFTGAKPWTSEAFHNDPKNFQFAILGDRTGGANPKGDF